jgi:hypothetical protein
MRSLLLLILTFAMTFTSAAELQNVEVDAGIVILKADKLDNPAASISVNFQPGTDLGQSLGTLFELKDADGNVVLGAGFDDAHSTYMRDNNRQLVFYYKSPAPEATVTPIGKPFDAENNAARLQVDGDTLVAVGNYGRRAPYLTPDDSGGWKPIEAEWTAQADTYGGVQFVENGRLIFENERITYNGGAIYTSTLGAGRYYYANGQMVICHVKPDMLYVAPWKPGEVIALESAKSFPIVGSVFTLGNYDGEILITTNVGEFYSFRDGNLTTHRVTDGKSWQGYSMTRFYDKVLIGQYPTGSLFQYDQEGLKAFEPALPVPEGVSANAREAQTLAIYGGYLYVGVWPWGELWRFDHEAKTWTFVTRVFTQPELSVENQEPFALAMKDKPPAYNAWGQRIVSLTNFQDSLYIATMNKGGTPWIPEVQAIIPEAAVAEYGRVHKLTVPGQVAVPFTWKPDTTLTFSVTASQLIVYQDGTRIGKAQTGKALDLSTLNEDSITLANGIYGPSTGKVSLMQYDSTAP